MPILDEPDGATPVDPDELQGLRHSAITTRGQLNLLEQANIQEGQRWLSRRRSREVLSEAFARQLHRKLFEEVWEWAGTFRTTEKNIGIDPRQISVEVRHLVDNTRYWIDHATFEPIEIAIRFHHRLVQIHLFPNGNGRHARIMTDELCRNELGIPPIDWGGGYNLEGINERRTEYIAALREADQDNFEPLLTFVNAGDEAA